MAKYTTNINEGVNGFSVTVDRIFTIADQREEFEQGVAHAAKQAALEMRKEDYQLQEPEPKTSVPEDLQGLYVFKTTKELHEFLQQLYTIEK